MAQATVSQNIASQREYLRPELELLYLTGSKLLKRMQKRTDVKAVSNRPSRIPFEVLSGGKPRSFNPDGGPLGTGSGLTEAFGTLSCTYFLMAFQMTTQAEWNTDSDEKAIKDYEVLNRQRSSEQFAGFEDAVLCYGDGSNTLDTVVNTTTNGLIVNNANSFLDGMDIDIYSSLGNFVASVTVQSTDILTNTIWLTGAVPAGVTTGYLLIVSGSAGVANSGINGILNYQVGGNAGSYMGIQRSSFPGKYSTPGITSAGALVPSLMRTLGSLIELSLGIERADEGDLVVHCNVDQRDAWENNAILVQRSVIEENKSDQSSDMLKRRPVTEMAGRPVLCNERARFARIDMLALKHWFRLESKTVGEFDVGGQTVFPTYAIDGGLNANSIWYMVHGWQVGNGQPRMGSFATGLNIPPNLPGH